MGPVDSIKCKNIHMTEVSEGEESEQGMENLFEEIIAENFPNLITEKVLNADTSLPHTTLKYHRVFFLAKRHIKKKHICN